MGEKLYALLLDIKAMLTAKPQATTDPDPKLKAAEEQLALVTAQLAAATQLHTQRDAQIVSLTADLEKAQGQVNAAGTENKTLADKLAAETVRVETTLAALGVDPKLIPAAPANPAGRTSMKRAAFSQLSPSEQSKFCRSGGKLTD